MNFVSHNLAVKLRTSVLLAILTWLCLPVTAQTNLNTTGSSNCVAADFDVNLQFANTPDHYFVILVSKRNLTDHRCAFGEDAPVYGPSFVPDRVEGHEPYKICYFCETRLPDGQTPVTPPVTLEPGHSIWQTLRWKSIPISDSAPCLHLQWMSDPVLVVATSLLAPVCSDVEVSRFSLNQPLIFPIRVSKSDTAESSLILSSTKNAYDLGERFKVHVSRAHSQKAETENDGCPTLYVRQRSPDGTTRIDEQQPPAFKSCKQHVLGYEVGDWKDGFDLDSGAASEWDGIGEHEISVLQLASSADAPSLRFVTSNTLRFKVIDPATLPRTWGPHLKGIAADISLDKTTYRLGEDVPLHLAIKNFDAGTQLYSWDVMMDPGMVIGIEVQEEGGHTLSNNERFGPFLGYTGHGFGPRPFPDGKVVAIERSLRREGWLPSRPGTYTIKMSWQPCFSPSVRESSEQVPTDLQSYATATATAKIKIVNGP